MSIKVIIVGRYQSGKTSIVHRIKTDKFDSNNMFTASVTVSTYELQGKSFLFNDISGNETYQNAVTTLFRNAKIAIIVFNIDSLQSFYEVDKWHDKIKSLLNVQVPNDPNFVSIILVGTKCDLENRKVLFEQGEEKAESLGQSTKYIEVSSKTGQNIDILKDEIMRCANVASVERINQPIQNDQNGDNNRCCT